VVCLVAVCLLAPAGVGFGEAGFPRTANIYWPALSGCAPEELERLSRYDVIVLASRNYHQAPDALAELRDLAPDAIILPQMPLSYHTDHENPPFVAEIRDALYENNWWLRDPDGEICRIPGDGIGLINMTTNCPLNSEGQRFCDWIPGHIAGTFSPGGVWDGVFLDCTWDRISWVVTLSGVQVDSDLDGEADDLETLNGVWREGTAIAMAELRDLLGEDYLMVSNGANSLWDDLNGTTLEEFPEAHGGWYQYVTDEIGGYIVSDTSYRPPRCNIVQTNWTAPVGEGGPQWSGYFVKRFLFTLASTLVFGDGYYCISNEVFDRLWWFPYYDLDLGEPLGSFEDATATPGDGPDIENGDMIKLRRFSQGVAVVNPTNVYQEIELPGAYYDPEAAEGGFMPMASVRTSITLSHRLGRILVGNGTLRPAAMGSVLAEFDGSAVSVSWDAPAWATRYAVYRRGVRGDGSMTDPELLAVTEATNYRDIRVVPMRCYTYSVAPIDDLDCEGWASDPAVVCTEITVEPTVALMVEDPEGTPVLTWSPPNVPGGMIFELERHDDSGHREWLGRFSSKAGETIRYADGTAEPGRTYRYELFEVLGAGRRLIGWVRFDVPRDVRGATALLGCRPQPIARWPARISFRVGDDDNWEGGPGVTVTIYDVRGRAVRRLGGDPLTPGEHAVIWDGLDSDGRPVASGCYPYILEVGGRALRSKAVVIR
jgi:hypothetical protein